MNDALDRYDFKYVTSATLFEIQYEWNTLNWIRIWYIEPDIRNYLYTYINRGEKLFVSMKSIWENDSSISLTIILPEISMLDPTNFSQRDTRTRFFILNIIFAFSLLTNFQPMIVPQLFLRFLFWNRDALASYRRETIWNRRSNCLEHAIQPRRSVIN